MCGICGFVQRDKAEEKLLQAMTDEIRYRGPDDAGYYMEDLADGWQLGFGHRRLAILDLSEKGHQPMASESGRSIICFNGEIYNFKELRRQLEALGHRFRTETDTEVILCAFEQWGIDAVRRFNGMFAFALYDRREGTLWLVRDRMGVKPLYYSLSDGGLLFASELKPLMRHPAFRKEIDRNALTMYLAAEYIPGEKSIFKNTFKLLPGEILQWTAGGIEKRRWWSVGDVFRRGKPFDGSYEDALQELDRLVEDAVRLRMISDVPLGAFLSNGVDSSLMTAKMQKLSDAPVKTFTVGFSEPEFDESRAASEVARYLGTDHSTHVLSMDEGKALFRKLPEFYDEPMADPSAVATLLVSRIAREHVTVAVSGDAGDELFGGYNTYTHFQKLRRLSPLSRMLNVLEERIPLRELGERSNDRSWVKLFHLRDDEEIIDADLYTWWDRYRDITDGRADPELLRGAMKPGNGLFEKAMLHDLTAYLPDDVLTKVDRASMAVSLETRAPLLDYRIVEFALSLPTEFKIRDGIQKRILKDLLYREIPEPMIGRRKKGFRIPFANWMRADFSEQVRWYFSDEFIGRQNLFDRRVLQKMLKRYFGSRTTDYAREVWTLLVFQQWYERYCIESGFRSNGGLKKQSFVDIIFTGLPKTCHRTDQEDYKMTFEEKYAAQGRKLDELKAKLDSAVDARKIAREKNREQLAADIEALDAKIDEFCAATDAKLDADAAKVKDAFTLDQATAESIASAPTGINEIQKATAGDAAAAAENVRLMRERRESTIEAAKLRTGMKVNAAKEKVAAHVEAIDKAAQEELILDLLDYAEGCYEMACAWAMEAEAAMMEAASEINDYTEKYGA